MNDRDKILLDAIHKVDKEVTSLKAIIDESVRQQFKEHDRRITSLEQNQRWVALAVIGAVIATIMGLVTIS